MSESNNYVVDRIKLGDIGVIEKIGSKCLPLYYNIMDLMQMIYDKNHVLFKVSQEDEILGFVVANFHDNSERLHIMSLGVLPEHRRKGLARMLINRLKEFPVKRLSLYVVEDNWDAIKFYAKQQFKSKERLENYYQSLNKSGYFLVYEKQE